MGLANIPFLDNSRLSDIFLKNEEEKMASRHRLFHLMVLIISLIASGVSSVPAEEDSTEEPMSPLSELIENEIASPRKVDFWSSFSNGMVMQELKADGKLVGAKESKTLFSKGDIVYIHLPKTEADEWILFRKIKKVYHPKTGKFLGDLIEITGALRVIERNDHNVTGQIIHSKGAISLKDEIAAVGALTPPATPTEQASANKKGGVIAEVRDNRLNNGEHDIVYIDQGWRDGILPGDQFEIIHGGEKSSLGRIPSRSIGRLLVLSSQEQTATARITSSSEPISKGDALQYLPR
jgi:chemotaxis protein MotB